jgi:hypothetical protein
MQFLLSSQQNKPNRVEILEQDKGEQYHIDYARWVIGSGSNHLQADYLNRYKINKNFYMNKQWCVEEDLEAFFKDENNNDRNRLQVTRNYIQPMVEQYRGNADRMTFDMKVANLSPMAKSRRERSLSKLIMYNFVANKLPGFADYIKENNFPTGNGAAEVESKFNNLYADSLVVDMNRLLRYSKNINKLEDLKMPLASDVALGGICIMRPHPYAGEWMFEHVSPDEFGWDRTAKEADLSDSSYFFQYKDGEVSTIFERYQNISHDMRKSIENFASNITGSSYAVGKTFVAAGKVPIYTAFWKDLTVDTFGYVTDEYGQRILHRINYIEENETKPQYTMDDLVPYANLTEYQKRVLKGSNVAQLYVDLWRYCEFIPKEILGTSINSIIKDAALEYGIVPYQEPDLYKPTNMAPPYKVGTWSYLDGITLSPVDVVINPQRMINRFLSVMENQINNSGGAGVVFDADLITEPEDEIRSQINKGEAVKVHAKGRGVQNVMGRYDSTPKESVIAFSALIESFKQGIEQVTGVNEGVKGDTGNPDQLVGVMQLMIQRGSIIQEPFYKALTDVFHGCYQSVVSSGRRYYADNEVELIDAVGEDAAQIIKLSKDTNTESLRVTLVRSMDTMNERMTTDAALMSWLQFGLIDQEVVSNLYGRCTMEEALIELREFQKRLANQKRMAAQAQAQISAQQQNVQNQAGEVVYNESVRDKTRDQLNKDADRATKLSIASNKIKK